MHLHFSWTRFTFAAPTEVTETQYTLARERPDELRRSARAQVRGMARRAVPVMILTPAAAAGCLWLAARFYSPDRQGRQGLISTSLMMAGIGMAFAAVFTVGSFLHYATAVTVYWREMTKTALAHASYPDFLSAWTDRQQKGIGGDRKLPWWLPWLILVGMLVVIYFAM